MSHQPVHNAEMPRYLLKNYLPKPAELRKHKMLKPVAHLLHVDEIWHLNRRSVAGAVFIGLFTAFIPLPGQMIIAAFLAIGARCNIAIAIALVWITNPFTIPPIFYFSYRLGAWLLNMQLEADSIELAWLWSNFGAIGYPLIFGSLVCGWVTGITGWVLTRVLWRLHVITRWHARRERIAMRKSPTPKN
jgi:uncharacterized protein (DUF2062 family)